MMIFFYREYAAVTVNDYGRGKVYYVGCSLEEMAMAQLMQHIILEANLAYEPSPQGGEIVKREINGEVCEIWLNHQERPQEVRGEQLAPFASKIQWLSRKMK